MRDDLKEAVIDAARDYLLGYGGTGQLRHALIAYETAALDESGMPMLAAGMVRADGLPPLTEMQQAEPFHECLSDAVNGGLSVMRIAPSDAVAALAASQEKAEPVAWMTHHDEPMLFPTRTEAIAYCDEGEEPIPLYAAPVAAQASEPVAWMTEDGRVATNDTKINSMSGPSRDAFNIPLYTAPQPSAEAVRDAALEEAAVVCSNQAYALDNGDNLYIRYDECLQAAHRIRALKSATPQPAEQPSASPAALTDELWTVVSRLERGADPLLCALALRNILARAQGEQAAPIPIELSGVIATLDEGNGFWRTCSGCHESNEGVPTGPYSSILKCHLGGGCDECGGIGAIWDSTDYQAMANDMARSLGQSVDGAAAQGAQGEQA